MVFPVQVEEVVSTVLSTHQHSYTSLMASHSERKRMDLRTASYSPIVPESIHVGRKRTQKEAPRSELTSQTTNQCHLPSGDSRRQKLTDWWKQWVPAFSTGKGAVRGTHFVCRRWSRGVVECDGNESFVNDIRFAVETASKPTYKPLAPLFAGVEPVIGLEAE